MTGSPEEVFYGRTPGMTRYKILLYGLFGLFFVLPSIYALILGDLREHTISFEAVFFAAFILYGVACLFALQSERDDRRTIFAIFTLAIIVQGILIFTRPTLSDDMYRYVCDGRVQAQGISPYQHPPEAPELAFLRDAEIYPAINRKSAVTIYPPAAEAAYAILWRIWPDNFHWFQIASATGGLLAGALLLGLLRDLGSPASRLMIYLWSPLLAFETAHAAHLDGLLLPFLVGAWWARVRQHDGLVGLLLGVATAMKLYPILLLPVLWRPRHRQGWWQMPLAFGITVALFYLPYTLVSGTQVLGYLPKYFRETFNISPLVFNLDKYLTRIGLDTPNNLLVLSLFILIIIYCWVLAKPTPDAETALRRCIWPIGVVTLLSANLFSWYLLWLLPLIAIFLQLSDRRFGVLPLLQFDAWTGWWLFCGLVVLSYTFFIQWETIDNAILAQFLPLYAFLLVSLLRFLWKYFIHRSRSTSTGLSSG
jgi:alpha-1,6-mannosyltransferase